MLSAQTSPQRPVGGAKTSTCFFFWTCLQPLGHRSYLLGWEAALFPPTKQYNSMGWGGDLAAPGTQTQTSYSRNHLYSFTPEGLPQTGPRAPQLGPWRCVYGSCLRSLTEWPQAQPTL